MNILIRVDASTEIGSGHVMRCLTLAEMFRGEDAAVYFICRELHGHLCNLIEDKGFQCLRLINFKRTFDQITDSEETIALIEKSGIQFDLVIVDHYQIDYHWEQAIRPHAAKLMVIDDLANRKHVCDVLLDQNYHENFENRYDHLVPNKCQKLMGPKYLLLRPEFYNVCDQVQERDGLVRRMLIFFGGSDPTNETEKCLWALQQLKIDNIFIDVVVGKANPVKDRINERCREMGLHYHCQIDFLAELMAKAYLSIGAGGVTMWERMVLGLPSLTVIVAENQRETVEAASQYGAIWNLGWHENVKVENYVDNIKDALTQPKRLQEISKKGRQLVGHETRPSAPEFELRRILFGDSNW